MYLALLCKHRVCTKLKSLLGTLPVRRERGEQVLSRWGGVVSHTIGYTRYVIMRTTLVGDPRNGENGGYLLSWRVETSSNVHVLEACDNGDL